MTWHEIKKKIQDRQGKQLIKWFEQNDKRIYVDVEPKNWISLGRFLYEDLGARFIIASAVDTPWNGIDVLYHFDFANIPQVLSIRVFIKKPDLEIESIAPFLKSAEWIEREMAELFGIRFKNHPDMRRLLLPDEWPTDNFPLRRDQ